MGRETGEIRRDIAETREEIDTHLAELGGRVERTRAEMDVRRQARENLPQILGGAAIAGLLLGLVVGHGRRRYFSPYAAEVSTEEAKLAKEWRRLAKERERFAKAATKGEMAVEEEVIP
ncbi:MAG TPA: hypothetical protein PLJ35_12565 [Anaerolineae bacterium]|nr:hypothetical protein [Anaerolineae bacterium]HPL26771.1 hypothetical protein [Anaerolineae bacterium]